MFNEDNLSEFDAYIVGFDEEPLKKVRAIHLDDGIEYLDDFCRFYTSPR